jgi:hypothetical protein
MMQISGGIVVPGGSGARCNDACFRHNSQTLAMESKKCIKGSMVLNGTPVETCECSLAGATTCYQA